VITRRLSEDWDMTFGHGLADYARDSEAIGQSIKSRLQFLLEEWFLDVNYGVPWLQKIMVKPANIPLTEALIKKTILETEGVINLTTFNLTFNSETRKVLIQGDVQTIFRDTISLQVQR